MQLIMEKIEVECIGHVTVNTYSAKYLGTLSQTVHYFKKLPIHVLCSSKFS